MHFWPLGRRATETSGLSSGGGGCGTQLYSRFSNGTPRRSYWAACCLLNLKKSSSATTWEIIEFNVISRNSPFYLQHILLLWDELIELSISQLQWHSMVGNKMMQLHPFHAQLKGFFCISATFICHFLIFYRIEEFRILYPIRFILSFLSFSFGIKRRQKKVFFLYKKLWT